MSLVVKFIAGEDLKIGDLVFIVDGKIWKLPSPESAPPKPQAKDDVKVPEDLDWTKHIGKVEDRLTQVRNIAVALFDKQREILAYLRSQEAR